MRSGVSLNAAIAEHGCQPLDRTYRYEDIATGFGELSTIFSFPLIQRGKICHIYSAIWRIPKIGDFLIYKTEYLKFSIFILIGEVLQW